MLSSGPRAHWHLAYEKEGYDRGACPDPASSCHCRFCQEKLFLTCASAKAGPYAGRLTVSAACQKIVDNIDDLSECLQKLLCFSLHFSCAFKVGRAVGQ